MKLVSLTLSPFAGITNDTINFEDGLNVVCGPNEAGKSTIVRALLMTLFTPTNLTPGALKDAIEDYLPLPSGDTIHTELEFEVNNLTYKIEKWWGGTKATKLIFPDGTSITDPTLAQQKIKEAIEVNEATVRNILITNQSELKQCIHTLKTDLAVKSSLSDLLRKGLMQQDGVPAEDLRVSVQAKVDDYFNNWDLAYNGPKNRGGIAKKHKKEVGQILQAYYAKEETKELLRNATDYEHKVDELTGRIHKISNEITELTTFLEKFKKPYEDAKKREILDHTLESINNLYSELNTALLSWPQLEAEKARISLMLPDVRKEVQELSKEQDVAMQHKSAEVTKTTYLSAKQLQEELEKLKKEAAGHQEVTDEHVSQAQRFEKEISDCTLSIELQKLKLNLTAKEEVKVFLKYGISDNETFLLGRNEQKALVVNGKFQVEAGPIVISAESGNADIPALEKKLYTTTTALQDLLSNFKVKTVSELIALRDICKKEKMQIVEKGNTLKSLLQGQTFVALKEKYDRAQQLPSTRPFEIIQEKLMEANTKEREMGAKLQTTENNLSVLELIS
jgi:DNA repair protein SbcC/Rad50